MKQQEGKILPSMIYNSKTGETRMWDDLTDDEQKEAIAIMAKNVMNSLGYKLVEIKFL